MNPAIEAAIAQAAQELARRPEATPAPPVVARPDMIWRSIRDCGTRLWLDTGDADEAARLWNAEFEALTTNNTLLNKEVQKGLYDDFVREAAEALLAAAPDMDERRLLLEIAFVLNARHGLMLVRRFNAYVSVELHTDLADDVERTVLYGRRFHAICPERFIVKVPLTAAGLIGARRLSDAGVPVNFTLGFSARQNVLAALIARPAYVNVFMGRLNAFVADNRLGDGLNYGEKATLATQRELYAFRRVGASSTRLIGASMRDGAQVGALAGVDVFTMPPKVAADYHSHPLPRPSSRVHDELAVATAHGVALSDFAGSTLWETSGPVRAAAAELGRENPLTLTPERIVQRLAQGGAGDIFPQWTPEDVATADRDGKIPVYAHWKERLASGQIGLDALMNLSALRSFTADQAALDERVRGLISSR